MTTLVENPVWYMTQHCIDMFSEIEDKIDQAIHDLTELKTVLENIPEYGSPRYKSEMCYEKYVSKKIDSYPNKAGLDRGATGNNKKRPYARFLYCVSGLYICIITSPRLESEPEGEYISLAKRIKAMIAEIEVILNALSLHKANQ